MSSSSMVAVPLGQVLKRRRKELELTLAQVGEALGLRNGNFIGMVERGERMPSDGKLLEVSRILGLNERSMIALKYDAAPGSAVGALLGPPPPALPHMRHFLLSSCEDEAQMRAEFERGERTSLERMIFDAILEYALVPALRTDREAPAPLRRRITSLQKQLRSDPTAALDPWWFEEEAEAFTRWARSHLHGWAFDLSTLTLRIRHSASPADVSTLPLVNPELRVRMLASLQGHGVPAATVDRPRPPSLTQLLAAEGLDEDDIEELMMMVELKKRRAKKRD